MICLVDRADHTKFVYRSGDLVMPLYCVHLLITLINLPTISSDQDKNNLHDTTQLFQQLTFLISFCLALISSLVMASAQQPNLRVDDSNHNWNSMIPQNLGIFQNGQTNRLRTWPILQGKFIGPPLCSSQAEHYLIGIGTHFELVSFWQTLLWTFVLAIFKSRGHGAPVGIYK